MNYPQLGYAHDALEPHFDARTMEIHHGKHHAGYTSKLNAAVEGTDMEGKSIEELLANHSDNAAIRNNGGGYYNHCLFWEVLSPNGGGAPTGELAAAIDEAFGSLDGLKGKIQRRSSDTLWFRMGLVVCEQRRIGGLFFRKSGQYIDARRRLWRSPDHGSRCMGACILLELPEPSSRLHRSILECCELGTAVAAKLVAAK